MSHLRYFRYVLRHKWWVFVGCIRLRLWWAGIPHDWTKFLPVEWGPYVASFYGGWKFSERPPGVVAAFDRAWLHHQNANPHHWQYWVLLKDDGEIVTLEMPRRYRREMVADWFGAGRAITGRNDLRGWYEKNAHKIRLHPRTRYLVEQEILELDWAPSRETP